MNSIGDHENFGSHAHDGGGAPEANSANGGPSLASLTQAERAQLEKRLVAQSFSRAASTYDGCAALQRELANELRQHAERLKPTVCQGIDIGCGTGTITESFITDGWWQQGVGLDLAEGMIQHARTHHDHQRLTWAVADAEYLPLASASTDLVFSNFALQWSEDLPGVFQQIATALRPRGVFAACFPTEGTLKELTQAWRAVDGYTHVNRFPTYEATKQALQSAGLRPISLLQGQRVLEYDLVKTLFRELKAIGAHNVNVDRPKALLGKHHLQRLYEAYECHRMINGSLPATYEVLMVLAMKL